jgi:uncharacterized protein
VISDGWHAVLHALEVAGSMTWQVTWSLILGFTLSAIIAALVRKSTSPGCCRMTGPRASGPHPLLAKIWGPIIGPLVAVASFVCSIGNVPLAAVLWNGGISFGGVVSFIFADLIIIPLLLIYRKYYGTRMALVLAGTFYVTMVTAGYLVEILFGVLRLIPTGERNARVGMDGISWNYTSVLNIILLIVAALLVWRFLTTGGRAMLAMMGGGPDDMGAHDHDAHHADDHGTHDAHHSS